MRKNLTARLLIVSTTLAVILGIVAAPAQALNAPVLSFDTVTQTSVHLSWTDGGNEQNYKVYKNSVLLTTLGANVLTYTASGLIAGTTYTFRVDAKKGGTQLPSNTVSVTTLTPPPPSCTGVQVPITADLRTTFLSYGAGTTYCLAAGTYTVPVSGDTTELRMDAGDVVWGAGQGVTIIDGTAVRNIVGATGGASYAYTFRDLTIGHAGRFINPGSACPSSGDCGKAFASGIPTLLNLRCFDNGTVCVGVGVVGATLDTVECDGNSWHPEAISTGNAACVKFMRGTLTVRNSNIHDNFGKGLWADFCDNDLQYECVWLVENNQFIHNGGSGLTWEVSGMWRVGDNAVIRNNTIQNNGWNSTCNQCGNGLLITDGVYIDVYGNTFGGNQYFATTGGLQCCRGVRILGTGRNPDGAFHDVLIHDNIMNGDLIVSCTTIGVTCTNNTP
jgi:hypothetical protein